MTHTRRQFMGELAVLAAAPELAFAKQARAGEGAPRIAEPPAPPAGDPVFFTPEERLAVARMAEHVLPGSSDMGVVAYIEQLATALEFNPPRIYAGGPFSGRQPFSTSPPGTDDFLNFLPLNRVHLKSWQLFLYGSDGTPGGNPNQAIVGKVTGLRDTLKQGLAHAASLAPDAIQKLDDALFGWLWNLLHPDFKNALTELVIEGAFSAPEYGGNTDLSGWKLVHFAGDTLPAGYSTYDPATGGYTELPEAPVTSEDPGPDPDPLSFFTKLVFRFVALVIGRNFE